MADISAIFFIILIIGVAYPALLTAWWLLFPAVVDRARLRLERTPGRSFWMGLAAFFAFLFPILILLALPSGLFKFFGWVMIATMLSFSSLGAAGLAARFAERINRLGSFSPLGAHVRGAVVIELASFFPILGWFVFFPIATVTTLGAAAFAVMHWMPRPAHLAESPSAPVQSPAANH